jgi:hypothetical protein
LEFPPRLKKAVENGRFPEAPLLFHFVLKTDRLIENQLPQILRQYKLFIKTPGAENKRSAWRIPSPFKGDGFLESQPFKPQSSWCGALN